MTQSPHLYLVLADQLSFDLKSLEHLNAEPDTVLLVEVMEEASQVPHHPHKIVLIISAMRHFAHALREPAVPVQYVPLDD
ncbi:cryptochrome/photolyase family protein, partial [Pseudomonas syringae group genomosp. 7]|uniref:cryptochrome/photolyase family protein n=1 Tax=Pseudomonas syringae group genomosp. 7 TaxID=251699 RepID=UPI00377073FB